MKHNHHDCRYQKCTSKINFFKFMDEEDQERILQGIEHYSYEAGETVFEEGEFSNYVTIIEEGSAKLNRYDYDGIEHILGFLNPGDIIGDEDIFGSHIMDANAIAISPLKICKVKKEILSAIVADHPSFAGNLLKYMSEKIKTSNNKIWMLLSNNSLEKIAKFILNHGKNSDLIEFTIDEIASAISTRRETVSRKLSLLQKYGVIERIGYKQIKILDYINLELIAYNDYEKS
ncbi:MAG: Crp/Fnr family transcriptional regulator [Tissierellia bacterium]|nr:Crp/Fnr family transcriptional regulator [Tissierellia bacterium]